MARAMATRCSCPPDSSLGLWRARSSRPTSVSAIGRVPPALRGRQRSVSSSGSSTFLCADSDGQQVVELEDEADVGGAPARPARRSRAGRCAGRRPRDAPVGRRVQPADQVEQRGLAGAGRAHQRHEVAARDVEVDAVQHLDLLAAAAIDLGDAADLDQGRRSAAGPSATVVGQPDGVAVLERLRRRPAPRARRRAGRSAPGDWRRPCPARA